MNSPEDKSRLEELAALHALGLLTPEEQMLLDAMQSNEEAKHLVRDFAQTAALIAYEVPQVTAPPGLRDKILAQLHASGETHEIISFPSWLAYAIAACLMIVGIAQAWQIMSLKSQLVAAGNVTSELRQNNALIKLRLAVLEAKDRSYASSRIIVAWDPTQHRGTISLQNLPSPPAGHDYQLWLLDPGTKGPISAGLLTAPGQFAAKPASESNPAFAISLEPSGGSLSPTGPILFASSPAL